MRITKQSVARPKRSDRRLGKSPKIMTPCMYVCKTLFTDVSLVNKIVGFHKGRQTIKKKSQGRYLQKDRKGKKKK